MADRKKAFACLILLVVFLNGCSVSPGVQTGKSDTGTLNNNKQSSNNESTTMVLEILGRSKDLSQKAWSNMLAWRKDMIVLVQKYPDEVFINGYRKEKMVALTFDDGPDQVNTPKIINILHDNGVKGNFFFIGQRAIQNHDVVEKAFKEGNLVLSHGYQHLDMTKMTADQIKKEITQNNKILYDITGRIPALMRSPFGAIDSTLINEAAASGEKLILWSIDTLDWSQMEKDNIVKNVLDNVRPGEIILMHSNEDKKATVEALPAVIQGLKQRGYQIVGLDQLLGVSAYK